MAVATFLGRTAPLSPGNPGLPCLVVSDLGMPCPTCLAAPGLAKTRPGTSCLSFYAAGCTDSRARARRGT